MYRDYYVSNVWEIDRFDIDEECFERWSEVVEGIEGHDEEDIDMEKIRDAAEYLIREEKIGGALEYIKRNVDPPLVMKTFYEVAYRVGFEDGYEVGYEMRRS